MIKHGFEVLRNVDDDLVAVQDATKQALDTIVSDIPGETAPQLVSFVRLGNNGIGAVPLPAIKDETGRVLRRAQVGMRVVAILDLSSNVDRQTQFEQTISIVDQIQQRSTANMAATTLFVVLVR